MVRTTRHLLEALSFFSCPVTMQLNATKEAHFITGVPDPELDPTVSFCVDILYSFNKNNYVTSQRTGCFKAISEEFYRSKTLVP
jgi:hypothetical protein